MAPVSGIEYNLTLFNWGCTHFVKIFYIICHCQRQERQELQVYEKSPEKHQWKVCIYLEKIHTLMSDFCVKIHVKPCCCANLRAINAAYCSLHLQCLGSFDYACMFGLCGEYDSRSKYCDNGCSLPYYALSLFWFVLLADVNNPQWTRHKKHVFAFSEAGKPIYSR